MPYHPEEHPSDVAWYALTGPQRRLVKLFMGDLERGVDLMDQLDMSPVIDPTPAYLVTTYQANPEDSEVVADWFTEIRRNHLMKSGVRGILDNAPQTPPRRLL